jgi:hypothetical protein
MAYSGAKRLKKMKARGGGGGGSGGGGGGGDKIDEYRRNWLLHLQQMPQN